ncbi:MAG: hypothetical protein ACFFEY_01655 [Candidatus Thorarchaeota archaeon]
MGQKNSYMDFMNPIFIKIKKNSKNLYDTLTKPKIVKISIYVSLLTFLPGLIVGLIIAINYGTLGYNLWYNWISDLGSRAYTPAPFILDLTCIISAIFIVPLILNLTRLYSSHQNHKLDNTKKEHYIILFRRIFGYVGVVCLFIGVIGMFFVGVFSLDRSPFDLHYYFSTSAFGGFAFGAFFTGLAIVLRKRIFPKIVGYFMIFGPSTASIVFLISPAPLTKQFLEWMLMFSSLAWYYVIVFITLQKLNSLLFFNPNFKW